jgi:4a-hydroxytetrahydrobiopterin dehydratase
MKRFDLLGDYMQLKKTTLKKMVCEPCGKGALIISPLEKIELIVELPNWQLVTKEEVERLQRVYIFKNFLQAMEFTNKVGLLAEAYDHHPEITVKWGEVTVVWWTHSVNGLHKNDFILSSKTDELYDH